MCDWLFKVRRKTSAMDVWSANTQGVAEEIAAAMVEDEAWVPGMSSKAAIGIRRRTKARLFAELPEDEQEQWHKRAMEGEISVLEE
jgi:hypothetical protein